MNNNNKRIITCAITGSIHTPTMSEYLPISPEQIAQESLAAASAGASVVHIHARDPQNGMPSASLELFEEIIGRIRDKDKEVIICVTTGGGAGMTVEQRAAVIPAFKPELASCNLGTINWGVFALSEKYQEFKYEWEKYMASIKSHIFQNTFEDIIGLTAIMEENGVKPEFECYDVGHLYNCAYLLFNGYIKAPIYLQFVTGVLGGIQATAYDLMTLHTTADRLFGAGQYRWSVIGAGRQQMSQGTIGLLMGGGVRVGLEDNLYISRGVKAQSNAEQVAKIVRIMGEYDLAPASPAETRQMLDIS